MGVYFLVENSFGNFLYSSQFNLYHAIFNLYSLYWFLHKLWLNYRRCPIVPTPANKRWEITRKSPTIIALKVSTGLQLTHWVKQSLRSSSRCSGLERDTPPMRRRRRWGPCSVWSSTLRRPTVTTQLARLKLCCTSVQSPKMAITKQHWK